MCFRPTAAAKVIVCPGCQKRLTLQQGQIVKECPFCGADVSELTGKGPQPPK